MYLVDIFKLIFLLNCSTEKEQANRGTNDLRVFKVEIRIKSLSKHCFSKKALRARYKYIEYLYKYILNAFRCLVLRGAVGA